MLKKRDILNTTLQLSLKKTNNNYYSINDPLNTLKNIKKNIIDLNQNLHDNIYGTIKKDMFQDDPIRILRVAKEFIAHPNLKVKIKSLLDQYLGTLNNTRYQNNIWNCYINYNNYQANRSRVHNKLKMLFERYPTTEVLKQLSNLNILQTLSGFYNENLNLCTYLTNHSITSKKQDSVYIFYLSVTTTLCFIKINQPNIKIKENNIFKLKYLTVQQNNEHQAIINYLLFNNNFDPFKYPLADEIINNFNTFKLQIKSKTML